jgi:hypothetical protein
MILWSKLWEPTGRAVSGKYFHCSCIESEHDSPLMVQSVRRILVLYLAHVHADFAVGVENARGTVGEWNHHVVAVFFPSF